MNRIEIYGIETNNLKSINISLMKYAINLIIGPSGSGKTSLAYDTVAQIGQHEFMTMFADDIPEPQYKIKDCKNMIVTVPLRQSNFNNNIRSTIGTYFGLSRDIILIYSALCEREEDFFVLNRDGNFCKECNGLGVIKSLDPCRIINYDIPVGRNPIKCWNRYKDFYVKILNEFCLDYKIDAKKTFRELPEHHRVALLTGESANKYTISYKKANSFSRRTTRYYGILSNKPMLVGYKPGSKYYSDIKCPCCHGLKYSSLYDQYKILGFSIGEFQKIPFKDLKLYIDILLEKITAGSLRFALVRIRDFISKAIELHLGHLFFHRTIPSLSGGELLRLRMVQIFNTQLSDLLIILDEPLAGLSGAEKSAIYKNIIDLTRSHTVVVVDHGDTFTAAAGNIIALGNEGGKAGGFLIDAAEYLNSQCIGYEFATVYPSGYYKIHLDSNVYEYKGANVIIGKNCLNLLTGRSGVGKTTLLKEYLPQYFEGYSYISQKPLMGNRNSTVATVLNIFTAITEEFAKRYNKPKQFFSNQTGCMGACPHCSGTGYLEYGRDHFSMTRITCRECIGTGFKIDLKKYCLSGITLFDIWDMTVKEASDYFYNINPGISKTLSKASQIMLGHLQIGQFTETLSGGENIRIKLLKTGYSKSKVIGIDEPFKGLNNTEIYIVVKYLDQLRRKEKTLIIADHTDCIKRYFGKHLELNCVNGVLTAE